jgi:hypothetical protein
MRFISSSRISSGVFCGSGSFPEPHEANDDNANVVQNNILDITILFNLIT